MMSIYIPGITYRRSTLLLRWRLSPLLLWRLKNFKQLVLIYFVQLKLKKELLTGFLPGYIDDFNLYNIIWLVLILTLMIKKFNDVLFKLTGPACCGGGTRFPGPEGGLALGGARLCCCPGAGGLALGGRRLCCCPGALGPCGAGL